MLYRIAVLAIALSVAIFGCGSGEQSHPESQSETERQLSQPITPITIKLATTTSTENSGLLAHILPDLQEKHNIKVDVISVGTGKALQHGCAGDVDVVLVHAPEAEIKFIEDGCGVSRYYVAQNQFVIVGPKHDPAGLRDAESLIHAFNRIADSESVFISRGDRSGTHQMELSIWEETGIKPSGEWYIEAGQGMGAVLIMAQERYAYALTDSGTFYSMADKLELEILFYDDPLLDNIYSVIRLNPEKYPELKHDEAGVFIDWITSDETAHLIKDFEVNGYQLFDVKK